LSTLVKIDFEFYVDIDVKSTLSLVVRLGGGDDDLYFSFYRVTLY